MTSDEGRLAYQITVTAPGTRSQGWHGTLYDKDGKPMQFEPGKTVKINAGEFVSVAETTPWTPYGMIHVDMVRWMKMANGNVIMDSEPWAYRLYVEREGSKSEGWRGELLHGRGVISPPSGDAPVETPMGPYHWMKNEHLWGRHAWFHVSWLRVHAAAAQRA
jgi:hypothetical protein